MPGGAFEGQGLIRSGLQTARSAGSAAKIAPGGGLAAHPRRFSPTFSTSPALVGVVEKPERAGQELVGFQVRNVFGPFRNVANRSPTKCTPDLARTTANGPCEDSGGSPGAKGRKAVAPHSRQALSSPACGFMPSYNQNLWMRDLTKGAAYLPS